MKDDNNLSVGLRNLSNTLRLSGALCESEFAALRALVISREQDNRFREAVSLHCHAAPVFPPAELKDLISEVHTGHVKGW